ncbi:hypothetical protein DERP_000094 [Dermatophagoides pteronyssinus]|uniref:Uncharacterized protein n=1 Tax=Dermatophagoides pteronyssinus TaxID=6956 RepID=A0ABQ8IZ95_DERPT|nr:hypothetical protein DERP_000094 [Dermatophagoides pteronyssinus]
MHKCLRANLDFFDDNDVDDAKDNVLLLVVHCSHLTNNIDVVVVDQMFQNHNDSVQPFDAHEKH